MKYTVSPSGPLSGELHLPGDKSLSHRAALFAAMAYGESRIGNFLCAGVTEPLLDALRALGVSWDLIGNRLIVRGKGLESWQAPSRAVDCGNSATVLRLLAGALAASGIPAVLDGSEGLRRRPMRRIVEPLKQMGVPIQASPQGTAPIRLFARSRSQPLRPLAYQLPVASAQVKSCLLLASLAAAGPTTLIEPGPSRDHTERMLFSMGAQIHTETIIEPPEDQPLYKVTLTPPADGNSFAGGSQSTASLLAPLRLDLPGDISSAAFLIVAACITPGSSVVLREIGLNPGRTGLLDALQEMGADIQITHLSERGGEPVGDIRAGYAPLYPVVVSGPLVVRMIDEFPAFAVAASLAAGRTVVRDAAELRYKESDRIAALGQEMAARGVHFEETPDGFMIDGGAPIQGGAVSSHGDHRLAMALTLLGLAAQGPVTVRDVEIIQESYPEFLQTLRSIGAQVADG